MAPRDRLRLGSQAQSPFACLSPAPLSRVGAPVEQTGIFDEILMRIVSSTLLTDLRCYFVATSQTSKLTCEQVK